MPGGAGICVRPIIILLSLGIAACDPDAKDAGDVDDATGGTGGGTDSSASAADGSTEDTGDAGMETEWAMPLGSDGTVSQMVRSPNGVVLVLQADPLAPAATVMEISSTMDQLWSIDLPTAWVGDLTALDDGTYVLAGSTSPMGSLSPTVWRLSCCGAVDQTMEFPLDNPLSSFVVAEPIADGLLLAHTDGMETGVIRTSMDLVTVWSNPLSFAASHGARTSAGTVLVAGNQGDGAPIVWEIEANGPGLGMSDGQPRLLVGSGDDLVFMTPGYEQVWFEPEVGGAVEPVPLPGFTDMIFAADRRDRFGLAFSVLGAMGSTAHVVEFDAGGAVLRDVVLAPVSLDYVTPSAIAVGADDAIYAATYESEPGSGVMTHLNRIAPM